jgi:hypothetical protein
MRLVLVGKVVVEAAQAGVDALLDHRRDARSIIVAALDHRRRRRIGGGHRQQPLDLLDRSPHRDGRRSAPVADALGQGPDVLLDQLREAPVASEQLLDAFRGVSGLVLRDLGGPHLRAAHVIDGELVLLLRQRLEVVLRDEDQQVTGDDLLGAEPVHGDLTRLGEDGTVGSFLGRAAIGAEVRPAVVETLVAQDRGPGRVALQDPVPEPVGEVVDGSVRIEDDGHG